METKKIIELLNFDPEKVLNTTDFFQLSKKLIESNYQRNIHLKVVKAKLESMICNTPSGEFRNELTELNILLNMYENE